MPFCEVCPSSARGRRLSAIALLGLGLHWGSLRSQNRHGHLLGHVRDAGLSSADPNVRVYLTRERQNYHTDSCDVVGLLCLHPARSGGLSSLVSSVTIFNEMRKRRADLARVLFERIETDRRGEVPEGQKPFFTIPVFNWYAGSLSTIYNRTYIESARRFSDVSPLEPAQVQALDLFEGLANAPALHFQMELQAGDIQLVHNHTMLHDRTAFEDWPEPERKAPPAPTLAGSRKRSASAADFRRTVWLGRTWCSRRNRGSRNAIHGSLGAPGVRPFRCGGAASGHSGRRRQPRGIASEPGNRNSANGAIPERHLPRRGGRVRRGENVHRATHGVRDRSGHFFEIRRQVDCCVLHLGGLVKSWLRAVRPCRSHKRVEPRSPAAAHVS